MFLSSFFSTIGNPFKDVKGTQRTEPSILLIPRKRQPTEELAMQISTVMACTTLLAETVASMPIFVYRNDDGNRELARNTELWSLLHDGPNEFMTPVEFWAQIIFNMVLRGNGFARLKRENDDPTGRVLSMMPLNSQQVRTVYDGMTLYYVYTHDGKEEVIGKDFMFHLKSIGGRFAGASKMKLMAATIGEATDAQETASTLFGNANKPSGVLSAPGSLDGDQRGRIAETFAEMAQGNRSGLFVLEGGLTYTPLTLTPAETQLLETRRFSVEEICRWFGVPSVLVGSNSATTWGSGIEQIILGFQKFTLLPLCKRIEQAIRARIMTPAEFVEFTVEISMDNLLRATMKERMEIHGKAIQYGVETVNEARQYENLPPVEGGDVNFAQSALRPVSELAKATVDSKSKEESNGQTNS